jgi:hypothetical protein
MGDLGSQGFTGLLVTGSAWVAGTGVAWLLVVLVGGIVEAVSDGRIQALRLTGCPASWRRRLLRALVPVLAPFLGVGTVSAATASPPGPDLPSHGRALPTPTRLLEGLPLPDRQPGGAATTVAPPSQVPRVEVHAGDTLWALAARLLPAHADNSAVASLCERLYALNKPVIGDNPDLIRPGQRLRVPEQPRHASTHPEEEDR